MLSYRHAFHAGNFADVLKHCVLVHVLEYMTRKDKAFTYIDTHSGAGIYSLVSEDAVKNREYETGIGRLDKSTHPALASYLDVVSVSKKFGPELYPGSPEIARQILREQDSGYLYELHPSDFALLSDHFNRDNRFSVEKSDGFRGLIARMPPKSRRGVVLIDPSYEIKTDYDIVVDVVTKAYKRFATGIFMIWYPVVERERIDKLEIKFKSSGITNIQLFELGLSADTEERGMTSSGMIVINPPYTLKPEMDELLPSIAYQLSNNSHWRSEELVAE